MFPRGANDLAADVQMKHNPSSDKDLFHPLQYQRTVRIMLVTRSDQVVLSKSVHAASGSQHVVKTDSNQATNRITLNQIHQPCCSKQPGSLNHCMSSGSTIA